MIFQVSKSLNDLKDKISEEEQQNLTLKIDKLKNAHNEKNIDDVKKLMDEINNEFQSISQKLYESTNETSSDEEVTNVDFEEVK